MHVQQNEDDNTMKTLYLMRHAESGWNFSQSNDFDLSLSLTGKKEAKTIGQYLHEASTKPDVIISSPARRALFTAQIVADVVGYPVTSIVANNHIYGATLNDLLYVVHTISDECKRALIVGHNPAISHLASYLTTEKIDTLPTAGIFASEFKESSWGCINHRSGSFLFKKEPVTHM